jgi:sigma-E factor negative regulatory protein RseA
VNQELESQLSAMFDGELPAAECELLSRRIARDENLRAAWSRYALIGAAMRSEPVATAGRDFAVRVSAALDSTTARAPRRLRRQRKVFSAALAATLVASVAGLSVSMLRQVAFNAGGAPLLQAAATPSASAAVGVIAPTPSAPAANVAMDSGVLAAAALKTGNGGSLSYVTPAGTVGAANVLRTQLADYIVAHSAYSTPLLRRNLLSELVTSEDQMGIASFAGAAGATGIAGAVKGTAAGGSDATRPISDASR